MVDCPCEPQVICIYDAHLTCTWPDAQPCTVAAGRPWHIQDPHGWLHLATINDAGNLVYKFSRTYGPMPGWDSEVIVDPSSDCDWPRMAIDALTERITLVWFRSGSPAVWQAYSDDDGTTWSAPTLFMANIYEPDIGQAADGDMCMSWFVFDAGTSGPGTIHAKFKRVQDTNFGAEFTLKDTTGANIKCAELRYGNLTGAWASHAPWTMALVIDGEVAESVWMSTDSCESWMRLS